jgi:hypothetical protein
MPARVKWMPEVVSLAGTEWRFNARQELAVICSLLKSELKRNSSWIARESAG